ncbi:hypothetical protein IHC92_17275 [Photobacterium damselae subsp. damselae]|uniref:hypothetical protein n=1 Tax=Photobacterium damselae TaxID=38293 RepID=UPI001F2803CF|nr:hypothetical protein [Photobacterium damselae]UKA07758.1 hypothetical protein IHC90_17920 [Photobacterium damselae subsp. damselae]UKA23914.1 hypothetical protein IHC92_17275 [Photobacterium damselae subsp. damselae]
MSKYIVIAIVIGIYIFSCIYNEGCIKPQVIEAHMNNCNLLKVEESCSWLKRNNIRQGYTFDSSKAVDACVTSKNLSNYLVKVVSKNKVGSEPNR